MFGATSAPSATSATSADEAKPFKQPVEGCTFEIDLVPFKSPKGDTLYVSTTEIPWELFDVFVYGSDKADGKSNEKADAVTKPTKPYIGMDREFGHVGFPVISPSYLSCVQFCEWLSAKTGRTYRLPTGDEWKALCEQSGIDPKNCGDYAWTKENAGEKTHKLASKKADVGRVEVPAPVGGLRMITLQRPPERVSNTQILGTGPEAAPAVVDLLVELGVLK